MTYSLRGQRRRRRWPYWLALIVLLGGYGYWVLSRPLPTLKPNLGSATTEAATPAAKLAWPTKNQAAVGIVGSPILETHGNQKPAPTASTAKLVTVLTVLQKKPLKLGEQGPTVTLSTDDEAIFNSYFARDGSLAKVKAGEKITEYQMLEAILLPSANNVADSLAIWAFGSLPAYATAANQYLKEQGLNQTHVGKDASGFDPSTVSTAHDLARIGELIMQNPMLAQIVGKKTAKLPVAGKVRNVNFLLGSNHIVGVKTGDTDQAGGVYVSASRISVNDRPVTIVTAVMGSPTLFQALKDSTPLIKSAQANFSRVDVINAGQIVASYRIPWGGTVSAVSDRGLETAAWNGIPVISTANLKPISTGSKTGQTVGSFSISGPLETKQKVDLKLTAAPGRPSIWWRLTHPF